MNARKLKFESIPTKWEKRQATKEWLREKVSAIQPWKKACAKPLEIGSAVERKEALSRGTMVFRDGLETIELPLLSCARSSGDRMSLQGVFKIPGAGYVCVRTGPKSDNPFYNQSLRLLKLEKKPRPVGAGEYEDGGQIANNSAGDYFVGTASYTASNDWAERDIGDADLAFSFFSRMPDLAHMRISGSDYRGRGLSDLLLSKTEREQRARADGRHNFIGLARIGKEQTNVETRFNRHGYGTTKVTMHNRDYCNYSKTGKVRPFDNMAGFHRILARDPKTGKVSMFTFSIVGRQLVSPNREAARPDKKRGKFLRGLKPPTISEYLSTYSRRLVFPPYLRRRYEPKQALPYSRKGKK